MIETLYDGEKIKWYRDYTDDLACNPIDILTKDGKSKIFLSIFSNNRKKLKILMSDKPELFPLIEKINYDRIKDDQLIEILKKYDE